MNSPGRTFDASTADRSSSASTSESAFGVWTWTKLSRLRSDGESDFCSSIRTLHVTLRERNSKYKLPNNTSTQIQVPNANITAISCHQSKQQCGCWCAKTFPILYWSPTIFGLISIRIYYWTAYWISVPPRVYSMKYNPDLSFHNLVY